MTSPVTEIKLSVGSLGANCIILYDAEDKTFAIVDPGGDAPTIFEKMNALDAHPNSVNFLLTHAHFDHTDGLQQLYTLTGKTGHVYLGSDDKPLFDQLGVQPMLFGFPMPAKQPKMPVELLRDQQLVLSKNLSFQVLTTPGHSPGSVCYYDRARAVVYSGDTLFRMSVGRDDFPGGDRKALCNSIRSKLYVLPDDTRVVPGHNENTTIGFEKRANYFVRA